MDINRLYNLIEQSINKGVSIDSFQTTSGYNLVRIYGSGVEGTATYTSQQGLYVRNGDIVNYWFGLEWSGHTGTGEMRISIPYTVRSFNGSFMGSCETQNIFWPAGVTQVMIKAVPETDYALLSGMQSSSASSTVQMNASGIINGYLRYIAEPVG